MGYQNPLMDLPEAQAVLALPADQRAALEALMRGIRREANELAEKSWATKKGPMAAYWRAVSTYARHVAIMLKKGVAVSTPSLTPPPPTVIADSQADVAVKDDIARACHLLQADLGDSVVVPLPDGRFVVMGSPAVIERWLEALRRAAVSNPPQPHHPNTPLPANQNVH